MKARVAPIVARLGGALTEVDVDSDPGLSARFGLEIPVLLDADGRVVAKAPRRRRADREASRGLSGPECGDDEAPGSRAPAPPGARGSARAPSACPSSATASPEGLAEETVTALLKDSRGYLWVGSLNGLSRFDGERFRVYGADDGLPKPRIFAIAEAGGRLRLGRDLGRPRAHRRGGSVDAPRVQAGRDRRTGGPSRSSGPGRAGAIW